jgi:hypothetical protein
MNKILKYISTYNITFLQSVNESIVVRKNGKYLYHSMFGFFFHKIQSFLYDLNDNEAYILTPIISINNKTTDPYIILSKQFLITNQSNPKLIHNYLEDQLDAIKRDLCIDEFEDNYFFLIFKYKKNSVN